MNAYYENIFSKYQDFLENITTQATQQGTQAPRQIRIQQPSHAPEPSQADIYTYPQNSRDILQLLDDAINRETQDKSAYDNLLRLGPEEDKAILKQMQSENTDNYTILKRIYIELTGNEAPEPSPLSSAPHKTQSYCEGLTRALKETNQEILDYTRILYALQSRTSMNMMFGIVINEIRHNMSLNYLYTKNRCQETLPQKH